MNWNDGIYISYIVKTQKRRLLELTCDMKMGLEGTSWEGIRNEKLQLCWQNHVSERSWPIMKDLENHMGF